MESSYPLALTFDDVLLKPGYSEFTRAEIDISTKLTNRILLKIPIVSSPMDTVTESKLAIMLAKAGGIGFIHRNLTIQQQAQEVKAVKKYNLLVGAAIGSSGGYEKRVAALITAGVDVLLIDSAHGNNKRMLITLKNIKKKNYKLDIIAGNVATEEGAQTLISAGVDALRVGMGPGAICTTRIVSGMGMPQLSAILETAKVAKRHKIPIIADGGINYSGDITKALAAGASTVMLGRLFASTKESSGKEFMLKPSQVPSRFRSIKNGAKQYLFKQYRGMGSVAAMKRGIKVSSEDEFHGKSYTGDDLIAEGVEGLIPCSGTVRQLVTQLTGGLRSGMYYIGGRTIKELCEKAQFVQITRASLVESHPHDLFITDGRRE